MKYNGRTAVLNLLPDSRLAWSVTHRRSSKPGTTQEAMGERNLVDTCKGSHATTSLARIGVMA
jgi:hypothetical protein